MEAKLYVVFEYVLLTFSQWVCLEKKAGKVGYKLDCFEGWKNPLYIIRDEAAFYYKLDLHYNWLHNVY